MEHLKRDRSLGDAECARMCFGAYRTNSKKRAVFDWIHEMVCDDCGQNATNCEFVSHCMKCKETYYQDCAKPIPDRPQRRLEKIKAIASLDENDKHCVLSPGMGDVCPMELKLKNNPRHPNITFEKCFRDGCDYQSYPYETYIYNRKLMAIGRKYEQVDKNL